jgi:hypothetical protein
MQWRRGSSRRPTAGVPPVVVVGVRLGGQAPRAAGAAGRFGRHRDDVGGDSARTKPAPDLFLAAAAALGADPARCVVLEDSPNGVAAGRAAGMAVVAVPGPMTRTLDFEAADLVAASRPTSTSPPCAAPTGPARPLRQTGSWPIGCVTVTTVWAAEKGRGRKVGGPWTPLTSVLQPTPSSAADCPGARGACHYCPSTRRVRFGGVGPRRLTFTSARPICAPSARTAPARPRSSTCSAACQPNTAPCLRRA